MPDTPASADEGIEIIVSACPGCGEAIEARWQTSGLRQGLLRGDYVLVADWLFHTACWDQVVEANPLPPYEAPPEGEPF